MSKDSATEMISKWFQYKMLNSERLVVCNSLIYRIAGNFRWSKFSRKWRFPSRRNFRGFNFRVREFAGYWPHPFIVAWLTEDQRCPMGEGRTSSAGLKQPSPDRAGLAHKTHVWKFPKVHVFKFFRGSYFRVFVVGRENRENLDLAKISRYTVASILWCTLVLCPFSCFQQLKLIASSQVAYPAVTDTYQAKATSMKTVKDSYYNRDNADILSLIHVVQVFFPILSVLFFIVCFIYYQVSKKGSSQLASEKDWSTTAAYYGVSFYFTLYGVWISLQYTIDELVQNSFWSAMRTSRTLLLLQ